MNVDRMLTVISIMVGAIIAIYLAWRQGVFKQPKLSLAFGQDNAQWLVAVAVPRCQASEFLINLPLVLKNEGNSSIDALLINITCGIKLDLRAVGIDLETDGRLKEYLKQIHRSDQHLWITYEIPVLRPHQDAAVAIPIVLRRSDFKSWLGWDGEALQPDANNREAVYLLDQIHCRVKAANHHGANLKTWLLAVMPAENLKELTQKSVLPKAFLLKRDGPKEVSLAKVIWSHLFSRPCIKVSMLSIVPELVLDRNPVTGTISASVHPHNSHYHTEGGGIVLRKIDLGQVRFRHPFSKTKSL